MNARLRERVHQGQIAEAAIRYVNRALDRHGLLAFDARNPEAHHQAAASTLGVSLELLDDPEREKFTELAVFPEDAEVPLETVERLWGTTAELDDQEAELLAERLFELSLLQSLDLTTRRLRIHDVVRSYLGTTRCACGT